MSDAPMMHTDGSITLPPNPFGSSATWADYDWRGIAAKMRAGGTVGHVTAARVFDLIADAVRPARPVLRDVPRLPATRELLPPEEQPRDRN